MWIERAERKRVREESMFDVEMWKASRANHTPLFWKMTNGTKPLETRATKIPTFMQGK